MKIKNLRKLLFFLVVLISCQNGNKRHHVKINIDYKSSDILFKWFKDLPNKKLIDSILIEPGIQIMAENVKLINDTGANSIKSFKEEIQQFCLKDTINKYYYGLDLAWNVKEKSSKLLEKIKGEKIEDTILERALTYIPNDYILNTTCNIYFVLTGWEWGDAYVCTVKKESKQFAISEKGEPTIMINLSLISKLYGETVEEQSNILNGVLSHEIFHFLFAIYKRESPKYNQKRDTTIIGQLCEVIQNEGIAHYIDMKPEIIRDYKKSQKLQEREFNNIKELNNSFIQLISTGLTKVQKQEILQKANVGKYWSKYGAITGMFIAYHIEKEKGKIGLQESVQKGPIYFLKQYIEIQKMNNSLPDLCRELKNYINEKTN